MTSFRNEVTKAVKRISESCDPLKGTAFRATATVLIDDIRTECNRLTAALEESPDEKSLREKEEEYIRSKRARYFKEMSSVNTTTTDPPMDPIVTLREQVLREEMRLASQAGVFSIKGRVKPISWFEGRVPAHWLSDRSWRREHSAELKNLTELETKCSGAAEALRSVPALAHETLDDDEVRVLESVRRKIEAANARASGAVKTLTETTWAKRSLKDIVRAHHLKEDDKVKVVHGVSGCDFERWIMAKLKAAGVSVPDPRSPESETVKGFDFLLRWAWQE